jgi:arsenate reductase
MTGDDMTGDDQVSVYFNPGCSKCRTARRLLDEQGIEANYVRYLDEAPSRPELERVMRMLGLEDPRGMMRTAEPLYAELGLDGVDGDALLDAMAANPILIERPIVIGGNRAVIARPPDRLLELLE